MTKGKLRKGRDGDILDPVSSIAARITLESCVEELEILKTILREVERESCDQLYQYVPPEQRFATTPKKQKIFEEEVYESIPYTNTQKLMADIGFLATTMKETCVEISQGGCFKTLIQVTEDFGQEKSENEAIDAEYRHNIVEIVHLKQHLKQERESFRKELDKNRETVLNLQDQFESTLAEGNQRFSYLADWETAREDQNNLRLSFKEKLYTDEINSCLVKLDVEERVHGEIQNFIEEKVQDLLNDIQHWMERYDSEIERMDAVILKTKIMWEELEADYVQLQSLYDLNKVKVDQLLWEKEEKRRQMQLLRLRCRCAVIIQRWWRKVMKEKHLGPYKIKKKVKKGKKNKGKK